MINRRPLGAGPQAPAGIRAAQADLLDALPNLPMPDLAGLRARGVLGGHTTPLQNSPTASGDSGASTVADASGETNSSRSPSGDVTGFSEPGHDFSSGVRPDAGSCRHVRP